MTTLLIIRANAIMALNPFSPVSPARVKFLLIPVGQIKQSIFEDCVKRLQQENVVRLGDVSPDSRPHRSEFVKDIGFAIADS